MLKQKYLMIGIALLLASSTLFAKSKPYLGLSAGADKGTWNAADNTTGENIHFGGTGLIGTVFGGYGAELAKYFYLGGEGFIGFATTSGGDQSINHTSGRVRTTYSYGASVIPGVILNKDTMVYGRLGLIRTRFEKEGATAFPSSSKILTGRQVGVGIQTTVTKHIDARVEYTYAAYPSMAAFGSSIKPHDSQISVGLVYHFG